MSWSRWMLTEYGKMESYVLQLICCVGNSELCCASIEAVKRCHASGLLWCYDFDSASGVLYSRLRCRYVGSDMDLHELVAPSWEVCLILIYSQKSGPHAITTMIVHYPGLCRFVWRSSFWFRKFFGLQRISSNMSHTTCQA